MRKKTVSPSPAPTSETTQPLRFRADGTFKVLQMADIQDGPDVSPDTVRLIAAAIEQADPDLVVLTGDQIRGYDPAWMYTFLRRRGEDIGERVRVITKFEDAWQRRSAAWHTRMHTLLHGDTQTEDGTDTGDRHHALPALEKLHQDLEETYERYVQEPASAKRAKIRARLLDDARAKVMRCFAGFLDPIVSARVPFAATYGNHDFQCGILVDEQDDLYREFAGCMNPQASEDNPLAPEPGTFALPIYAHDGSKVAMSVMMVNSGDYADDGQDDAEDDDYPNRHAHPEHTSAAEQAQYMVNARGLDLADSAGYGLPSDVALEWLEQVQHTLQEMNGNEQPVPSIAFQHIAPQDFYECLKEVPAYTPNAVEGARAFAGRCYVLNPEVCYPGGMLGESIGCADTNAGQVERMRKAGGYFALYCGHDHKNSFVGHVDGIDLGYAPTCGFTSYGPKTKLRGIRLFEFHESDPTQYSTRMLNWSELVGGRSTNELRVFVEDHVVTDGASLRDQLRQPAVFATMSTIAASVAATFGYVLFRFTRAISRAFRR